MNVMGRYQKRHYHKRRRSKLRSISAFKKYTSKNIEKRIHKQREAINAIRETIESWRRDKRRSKEITHERESLHKKIESIRNDPNNRVQRGRIASLITGAPRIEFIETALSMIAELEVRDNVLSEEAWELRRSTPRHRDWDAAADDLGEQERLLVVMEDALEERLKMEEEEAKKKLKTKEEHSRLKAKAAAYDKRERELAPAVRRQLRSQIETFERCPYCDGCLGDEPHADHIYPLSKGGHTTTANMVFICKGCNLNKGSDTLRQFITKNGLDRDRIERTLDALGKDF